MKKSTKLLSVILAIVMLFSSMTVLASAAKTEYKTAEALESMGAYSPYGAVTRLSTEERTSMVFDYLDQVLADANINLGKVVDVPLLGITLTIDLTSVTALCGTIDSVKGQSGLLPLLGDLKNLNLDSWQTSMTRDNQDQLTIVRELVELLSANAGLVQNILNKGSIDLGSIAGSFVDLSAVSAYLKDIPGLIKGFIFPLFERKDDDLTQMDALMSTQGNGGVQSVLNSFVKSLFTKPQSNTSYKENAEGVCISNHTLPTQDEYLRYAYEKGQDSTGEYYICYILDPVTYEYTAEEAKYYKTEEPEGSGEYVYKTASGDNLKYYENDSYWLPSFANALNTGAETLDLNTDTATTLLYKFIPYVFQEMAPVVLNGSVKKALAEWFGAKFTYVGEVGSEEVNALPDSGDVFFTQEQGEYLWEWSDYKVINGNHYYRFQDQIYSSDLSNTNPYFDIIKWDFKITGDFLNEFVPTASTDGSVTNSAAGYSTVLGGVNDFLGKVISTVFTPEVVSAIGWTKGGNDQLLENAKKAARYVVNYSPESIFGEDYNNGYYQLMMDEGSSNQEIVCGIAAKLLEFLMPQLNLPSAENLEGQNIGAMLAAIIRELATQFIPTYNYDALIYADYNAKTFLSGKDNSYWLDVCLTMGVDIGMSYLRNLADLGEDQANGYKFADSKTYDLAAFEQNPQAWEATVDWIVDWALCDDYEWTWKMEKFVDTSAFTIDLAAPQDPWVKLDAIFRALLPVEQILNVTPADGKTWLETALRDNFVGALLDLDIVTPVSMFNIPAGSVLRDTNVFSAVVEVVRDLLNGLLYKMAGGNLLDPATITSIDSIFNQSNIASFAGNLLSKLSPAYNNGLLDVAMPFLNFFVGWTTDAQKMANPAVTMTNQDGKDYMYTNSGTVTSTLSFRNDSAGMLLKHKNSDVVDQNYNLVIDGVSSNYGEVTASTGFPLTVVPGASASFDISMPYTANKAIILTVTYHYTFKDGSSVGGTQQMNTYQYVSNQLSDIYGSYNYSYKDSGWFVALNIAAWGNTGAVVKRAEDFATTVSKLNVTYQNKRDEWIDVYKCWTTVGDSNYIASSGQSEAAFSNKRFDKESQQTIYPFKMNPNADLANLASGSSINIGKAGVQVHSKYGLTVETTKDMECDFDYLYYADMGDLMDLFDAEVAAARLEALYGSAEWTAYEQAMMNVAELIYAPAMKASFASTYSASNIEAQMTALENAITALEESATGASYDVLTAALEEAEPAGTAGINYQDYELYEYWDYEENRNAANNMIAAYQAPEAPDKYIDGCGLSEEEINVIADAAGNATLTAAIKATMLAPSKADLDAYAEAVANYEAPTYSALDLGDVAAKIGYYKQFLIAKTTEKQFLAKEIEAANAQGYGDGSSYSTDSWAAYSAALAYANEVNSAPDALQSEVFNAKYNLMITQNQLMAKEDSAKDNGAYMQLESLIAQADVMFQNTDLYTVKEGDAADAWANLVAALGYEYEDENDDTQNLYVNSAKAYVASDRVMSSTTDAEIASQVATLQDAINQFTCAITVVPDDTVPDNSTNVEQTELIIDGLVPATIASSEDLLALVKAAAPEGYNVTLESVASAAGYYGTGATVKANVAELGGQTVATYTVVIYGDVNGDGAVDAFDAAVLDLDLADVQALTGAYGLAADTNADAQVAVGDYTLVKDAIAGTATINQVR